MGISSGDDRDVYKQNRKKLAKALHCIALDCTALDSAASCCLALHRTALHCLALPCKAHPGCMCSLGRGTPYTSINWVIPWNYYWHLLYLRQRNSEYLSFRTSGNLT